MDEKTIIKALGIVILGPMVVGAGLTVIGGVINGGNYVYEKLKYKKMIKAGLKDGSIVEIDGRYYSVEISEEA